MDSLAGAPELFLYPLLGGLLCGLIQIAAYLAGGFSLADSLTDLADGTSVGELFDWMNIGRVPLSILAMLLLTSFGITGIALVGAFPVLPLWVPALVAAPVAVGVTKYAGQAIAALVPRDESYAVTRDELVGRRGVVTLGPLDDGNPGNVQVRDAHGELHTIRARPADTGMSIEKGAEVVVVARQEGSASIFLVIPFDEAN